MTRNKFLAKSKTLQGIVIMLVPAVAQLLDFEWTEGDTSAVNEAINAAIAAVGAVWAAVGRFTAKDNLTVSPKPRQPGDKLRVTSISLLLAVGLALLVAGCASQDIRPETARERLVVAEYTYQGVLDEVQQAIILGNLRGEQAAEAAERLEASKVALDTLRIATQTSDLGDDFDAQAATDAALAALITYLETTGAIEPLPPALPEE